MSRLPYFALSAVLLAADQLTKLWAARSLTLGQPVPLIGNTFRLTRVHNMGGAFGIFPGGTAVFIAVSSIISVVLIALLFSHRVSNRLLRFGASIVLAGAVGNLIDRAIQGYVLDFFELRGFPVINVADACVSIGAALIILYVLFPGRRPQDADDHQTV